MYVRGGPLTDPIWQFFVLTSVGEVVWGVVAVFAVPEGTETFCLHPGEDLFVVDYDGGRFVPVTVTVAPNATGREAAQGVSYTPAPAVAVECPPPTLPP